MARRGLAWNGALVAAAVAGMVGLAPPARAQSNLSEQLSRTLSQAQKSDLQHQFGRALVNYGRALTVDPTAGVGEMRATLLRRASLYESVKDFAKAEADLTAALQLEPPVAGLYADRGYFYMRQGRFADALADFLAGARLDPDNGRFRFAAGRVEAALSNYSAALTFYDEAIRLSARDAGFYLARAEAFIHLDQPRRAWADYDHAIDIKIPRSIDRYFAFLGRGYASLMLADYRGAIADFDRALEIDPRAVSALLWRGYAREQGGQADLALDDYERATAVDPKDRWARANLQRLRSN
jgi:tetratricopeptide (TPR) repeat protein